MKTRTYRGASVHALMRQVREELGDNVVILGTREGRDDGIEIEIGLVNEAHEDVKEIQEEPSLGVLADLYRESDIQTALKLNGFDAELCTACAPCLRGSTPNSTHLAKALRKVITFNATIPFRSRVVALVGPTGAGKTTSIAKLTARLQVAFGFRIGLIAGDSYRVGAEFHLGAFADLLGVPLATLNPELPTRLRLAEALSRLDGCDLVFVDTPGASPYDDDRFDELCAFFDTSEQVERILTLPAPGNSFDLAAAAKRYGALGCSRAMITKVDESGYLGPVLNTIHRTRLPLAFITNGQRVPEDIEPASSRRLAWMVMRRMH